MLAVNITSKGFKDLTMFIDVLPKVLREEIGKSSYDIAKIYKDNLRLQLLRTSKRWDYKIFSSIKAKKISDFRSTVSIAQEGIWLDSMRPHWVSLKRGRRITQWAIDRFKLPMNKLPKAIQVKKHPFIEDANRRSSKRVNTQLRNGLKRAIVRSRK